MMWLHGHPLARVALGEAAPAAAMPGNIGHEFVQIRKYP